ncbi:MAG: hypothetical protein QXQ16_02650 [Candidatus Aenigmatarchaeota archaeon]
MVDIYQLFENYGFFHFIGPFLVIFSLIYGGLRKTGLFGNVKKSEKLYVLISISIAFYYIYSLSTVEYTQKVLSFFFYEILALFFILIILGFIYGYFEAKGEGEAKPSVVAGLLTLTVIFAFLYASLSHSEEFGYHISNAISSIVSSELIITIFIFVAIILIIWWMTSPGKTDIKKKTKEILSTIDSTFEEPFKKN